MFDVFNEEFCETLNADEQEALEEVCEDIWHDRRDFNLMDVLNGLHARILQFKSWYTQEYTEDELKAAEAHFNVLKSLALKVHVLCAEDITSALNEVNDCSYIQLEAA